MTRVSGPAHPVPPVLAWSSAIWLSVVTVEVLLSVALPEGMVRGVTMLPTADRLSAIALNVTVAAPLILSAVGVAMLLRPTRRRLVPLLPRWLRWTGSAVSFLLLLALLFAYGLAWGTLRQTGVLPGRESLLYFAQSGWQITQHVAQQSVALYLAVPAGAVALTVGLRWGMPRLVGRANNRALRRLASCAGAVLLLCMLGVGWALVVPARSNAAIQDPATGTIATRAEIFSYERDRRAGVFWRLAEQTWRALRPPPERFKIDPDIPLERRRQIPMAQYVASAREHGAFEPYNVVLILVESMRRDVLTMLGAEQVVMPNVERLAREGLVYADAYTQASQSDLADPCPMSSQYPVRGPFGQRSYRKNPPYPRVLVYDILEALGYRTAIISSQNETWGGMIDFLDTGNLDLILHSETFDGPTYVPGRDPVFSEWVKGEKRAGKIDDRITVGEVIRWIDQDPSQPFFLYTNLQNSHIPYEIPRDFERRFAPKDAEFSFTMAKIPLEEVPLARSMYFDALAYVDAQIGRLVDYLEAKGVLDRTIFVITGDTGQGFMEHGFFTHARDLYNEVMQVPIVLRGPSVEPGVDGRPAQHIDVAPTLLDLIGLPPHPSFHGKSLVDEDVDPERSRYLAVRTPFAHQYAVVRGRYKLIDDHYRKRFHLYDLETDPGERTDIAALRPALTEELSRRLDTWLMSHIEYYRDAERMREEYPPVIHD